MKPGSSTSPSDRAEEMSMKRLIMTILVLVALIALLVLIATVMVQINARVLEAIISLINSLVWPLVAVYVLTRFDDEIGQLLNRIQRVKGGGVEVEMSPERMVEAAVNLGLSKPDESVSVDGRAKREVRAREILAETVQASQPNIAQRLSQARLLWVDDNPRNNLLERRALESFGIEIVTSTSTADASEKLEKGEPFDVIISDMARPAEPYELAGYALLEEKQRIEEERGLEAIPFVIYAGSITQEYREQALEKGASGRTNKPEELFRLVKEAILLKSSYNR